MDTLDLKLEFPIDFSTDTLDLKLEFLIDFFMISVAKKISINSHAK